MEATWVGVISADAAQTPYVLSRAKEIVSFYDKADPNAGFQVRAVPRSAPLTGNQIEVCATGMRGSALYWVAGVMGGRLSAELQTGFELYLWGKCPKALDIIAGKVEWAVEAHRANSAAYRGQVVEMKAGDEPVDVEVAGP